MKILKKINVLKSKFKKTADQRSFKFVTVIECILNQNSRDFGVAMYPALNRDLLQLCMRYEVGILQIPCPEMAFMGLARKRKKGESIREALDTASGRDCCRKLGIETANRIQDYLQHGNKLLAVLGGNPESPACAIHTISAGEGGQTLEVTSGIFMKEFHKELLKRNIRVPFKGIRDCQPEWIKEDLLWLEKMFESS